MKIRETAPEAVLHPRVLAMYRPPRPIRDGVEFLVHGQSTRGLGTAEIGAQLQRFYSASNRNEVGLAGRGESTPH